MSTHVEAFLQAEAEAELEASIFATIVHSVAGLDRATREMIQRKYGCPRVVHDWGPGDRLLEGALHLTDAQPATDRNGFEHFTQDGGKVKVRFVSMNTAILESKL